MSTGNNFNKHKPKRIEKELLLLRNLPKEYKLGKRETPLGTLLYVCIFIMKNKIMGFIIVRD